MIVLPPTSPRLTFDGFVSLSPSRSVSNRRISGDELERYGWAVETSPGGSISWRSDALRVDVEVAFALRPCDTRCALDTNRKTCYRPETGCANQCEPSLLVDGELVSAQSWRNEDARWRPPVYAQGSVLRMSAMRQRKAATHEYELRMPSGASVELRGVRLTGGEETRQLATAPSPPPPRAARRFSLVSLGDSITQGFCADSEAWPSLLASHLLNGTAHNLGFQGLTARHAATARLGAAVGRLARRVGASLVVVLLGANDCGGRQPHNVTGAHLAAIASDVLSEAAPAAAVALITPLATTTRGRCVDDVRRQARAALARASKTPCARSGTIALIDGEALLPAEPPWMVDGLHPSAVGQSRLAQRLLAALKANPLLAPTLP